MPFVMTAYGTGSHWLRPTSGPPSHLTILHRALPQVTAPRPCGADRQVPWQQSLREPRKHPPPPSSLAVELRRRLSSPGFLAVHPGRSPSSPGFSAVKLWRHIPLPEIEAAGPRRYPPVPSFLPVSLGGHQLPPASLAVDLGEDLSTQTPAAHDHDPRGLAF